MRDAPEDRSLAIDRAMCALADARLDDLSDLTDHGLRNLSELCRHWQQLAENDVQRRARRARRCPAA